MKTFFHLKVSWKTQDKLGAGGFENHWEDWPFYVANEDWNPERLNDKDL